MRFYSALPALFWAFSATTDAFVAPGIGVKCSFGVVKDSHQPSYVLSSTEEAEVVGADADDSDSIVEEEDPSSGKKRVFRERHTIFVGNLPFDTTETSVKGLFDPLGKVELVSLPRRRGSNQPRGFAFVDMSTEEEMDAAISALDGQKFGGRILRVSQSVPKDEVEKQPRAEKPELPDGYKKIYMGNIPFECTREEVFEFYSEYGEVSEVYVPVDPVSGNGRGFAFVTMKEEDADKAIEATNGQEFGGRKLVVSVPLPPGKKAPQRYADRVKIYVGNLSFYTVRDTLKEIFEEFGVVHDCYMPEDAATGGSRGFGFVTMDKDAAATAIDQLDGCEVDGRIIGVNEAQPKRSNQSFGNDDDSD